MSLNRIASVTQRTLLAATVAVVSLSGCNTFEKYDVTLNEVTVYSATPEATLQPIADQALSNCLEQSLTDTGERDPEAILSLNCSHAGIASLDGLAQFSQLKSIKLSGNEIRNLVELERLTALRQLWLNDNQIIDPIPVLRIDTLRNLDLTGNPRLQCPERERIPTALNIALPEHCQTI